MNLGKTNTPPQNRMKLDAKTLGFGCLILVVLACVILILPMILGGDDDNNDNDANNDNGGQVEVPADNTGDVSLGSLVTTSNVDRNGCPTDNTSTFTPTDSIYVVAPNSAVSTGTNIFARLYREGQPVEDTAVISAAQDYNDTCINFVFEPTAGAELQPGNYEVVFVVNGNETDSVALSVQ